jgi:hypothetical protein
MDGCSFLPTSLSILLLLLFLDIPKGLVKLNASGSFHIMACLRRQINGHLHIARIVIVQSHGFQILLQGSRGFGRMIKGNFVEQMMTNMSTTNVMRAGFDPPVIIMIDCSTERGLDPTPFVGTKMRDAGMGVLNPCHHNQKDLIDHKIGTFVPQQDIPKAILVDEEFQDPHPSQEGNIVENNLGSCEGIGVVEERAVGSEMIGKRGVFVGFRGIVPTSVDTSAGIDSQKVEWIQENGMENENHVVDKALFANGLKELVVPLAHLVGESIGDVSFSFRQVIGAFVVFGVGVLPRKIGNQKHSVEDQSYGIVEEWILTEGAVAFRNHNNK